jgi:hypothetical protein
MIGSAESEGPGPPVRVSAGPSDFFSQARMGWAGLGWSGPDIYLPAHLSFRPGGAGPPHS